MRKQEKNGEILSKSEFDKRKLKNCKICVDSFNPVLYNTEAKRKGLDPYIIQEALDMSTFMANPQNVERKWYVIDAAGKPLGRVAVEAASILRGKNKVTFTPHVDCGDFVIVINSDKVVLTGNKGEQKYYRHYSGYPSGLKETKYRILMQNNSEFGIELAVKGMLPKNTIGRNCLTRLHVYKDANHKHEAQKPEIWNMD